MKRIGRVAIILLLLCGGSVSAQNLLCDSLLVLPADPRNIDLLLRETIYKKELKSYAAEALKLSETIGYIDGIMHSLDQLGVMERNDANYGPSMDFHNRCLALAESNHNDHWIMRSYINLGVVNRRIDQYETALRYFLSAFQLAEKLKNEKEIASCLGNIGTLYTQLGKTDEAMDYFRKSLQKAMEQNNYQGLSISYGMMGRVHEVRGRLDSARYCYEQNLFYSRGWNDDNGIAIAYASLGNVAQKGGDWRGALMYYREAVDISIKVGDRNYIAMNYARLGEVYLQLGEMSKAEEFYLLSLKTARQIGMKAGVVEALAGLSNVYDKQNRHTEALDAVRQQIALKDSILNEENLRAIEFLKISFEVLQKEQTIETLRTMNRVAEIQNRQKRTMLILGTCIIVILLLLATVYIRSTQQKKRLAQQQVKQLEQERQLVAREAMLDGEVMERTRLARDLHDRMGGLLSVIKFHLADMKQGVTPESPSAETCNRAIELLDESMVEMRRIAHHLMPSSLSSDGLRIAVSEFCRSVPHARFSWYGSDRRIDPKMELVIYRIAYELVNNAMKHSGASHIVVQIVRDTDRIAFTVQDNGRGFDPRKTPDGMGMSNIRNLVASYGGRLDIGSAEGEGTEINVEFEL